MSDTPISTWTRFQAPVSEPLDASTFKPLLTQKTNIWKAWYGRITETPAECLLVVHWNTRDAYDAFVDSDHHKELLANLQSLSPGSELATHSIDSGKAWFTHRFGPHTEIRTVYFPAPMSPEVREAVNKVKTLVLAMTFGFDGRYAHLCPYNGVPSKGWIEGSQSWKGQDVVAGVWCHHWVSPEAEEDFKKSAKTGLRNGRQLLVLEAFEEDLKGLGAVGWEDHHVNFKKLM